MAQPPGTSVTFGQRRLRGSRGTAVVEVQASLSDLRVILSKIKQTTQKHRAGHHPSTLECPIQRSFLSSYEVFVRFSPAGALESTPAGWIGQAV